MTPIAHSAIGLLGWQKAATRKNIFGVFLFLLIANLPDIDFVLSGFSGQPELQIHQSYTHNIFFIGIFTLPFFMIFKTRKERVALFLVSYSHLLLDVIIVDRVAPVGIRLFFPVSEKLFNLGFFPNFMRGKINEVFSWHNLVTIFLEIVFFVFPVLLISGKLVKRSFFNKKFWTI